VTSTAWPARRGELVAALPASGLAVLKLRRLPGPERWRSLRRRAPFSGYGVGAGRRGAGRTTSTLEPGPACTVPPVLAVGPDRDPAGAARRCSKSPTRWPRRRAALWLWGPDRDRGRGTGGEPRGSPMRNGRPITCRAGPVLVVDCFNAIPASAEAALRSLRRVCPVNAKLAILGLMAELGDRSESEHRRIALVAEELGNRGGRLRDRALRRGAG